MKDLFHIFLSCNDIIYRPETPLCSLLEPYPKMRFEGQFKGWDWKALDLASILPKETFSPSLDRRISVCYFDSWMEQPRGIFHTLYGVGRVLRALEELAGWAVGHPRLFQIPCWAQPKRLRRREHETVLITHLFICSQWVKWAIKGFYAPR